MQTESIRTEQNWCYDTSAPRFHSPLAIPDSLSSGCSGVGHNTCTGGFFKFDGNSELGSEGESPSRTDLAKNMNCAAVEVKRAESLLSGAIVEPSRGIRSEDMVERMSCEAASSYFFDRRIRNMEIQLGQVAGALGAESSAAAKKLEEQVLIEEETCDAVRYHIHCHCLYCIPQQN